MSLDSEIEYWNEAYNNAPSMGVALVAFGIYGGLRIAKDGSLDEVHKELSAQLFEMRNALQDLHDAVKGGGYPHSSMKAAEALLHGQSAVVNPADE